jgi:hypothetical protein
MARVAELHKKWLKDPEYKAAYDSLEEEFAAAAQASAKGRVGGRSTKSDLRFVIVRRAPGDYGWQMIGSDGSAEAGAFGFSSRVSARRAVAAYKLAISKAPVTDAAA